MAESSLVLFGRLVNTLSLYEALPDRPLVVHVHPDALVTDAFTAFLPIGGEKGVQVVEVLGNGSQRLTRMDMLRWLAAVDGDDEGVSVRTWLENRQATQSEEFLSLDLQTARNTEIPISHAVKLLEISDQFPIPVFARTDSNLNGVFGYVTAEQLLAAVIGNFFVPISDHPVAQIHDGTASYPCVKSSDSILSLVQTMIDSRKFLVLLTDNDGSFHSGVSAESILHAVAQGKSIHSPISEIQSCSLELLSEADFPIALKDLTRLVLLSEAVVVLSGNVKKFPVTVFKAIDIWRIVSKVQ